jgi:hypothetical protein
MAILIQKKQMQLELVLKKDTKDVIPIAGDIKRMRFTFVGKNGYSCRSVTAQAVRGLRYRPDFTTIATPSTACAVRLLPVKTTWVTKIYLLT